MEYKNLMVSLKEVAPEEIEKKIIQLEEEVKSWRHLYLDARENAYNSDVMVENQKQALKDTRKTLEGLVKENTALKELVKLWA